ncbi:MAG: hypothetical protein JRN57_04140 [Nitrososphaerota archaeon]|nr:hypothetical protein [Nitrososphaerota archaeon]
MATQEEFSRWKISKTGFVIGLILGFITFLIADAARIGAGLVSGFASSSRSGIGLTLSSNLIAFLQGGLYITLVVALIAVKIAHRTVRGPLEVRGPIKVVLGALTGIFYYFILAAGVITFAIGIAKPAAGTFELEFTLIILLALLEVSAGLKIAQGLVEFRDGRREARELRGAGPSPPPPAAPPASPAPAPAATP